MHFFFCLEFNLISEKHILSNKQASLGISFQFAFHRQTWVRDRWRRSHESLMFDSYQFQISVGYEDAKDAHL